MNSLNYLQYCIEQNYNIVKIYHFKLKKKNYILLLLIFEMIALIRMLFLTCDINIDFL